MSDTCANCTKSDTSKVFTDFKFLDPECNGKVVHLSAFKTLMLVSKGLSSSVNNHSQHNQDDIQFCFDCGTLLENILELYGKFISLTKLNSFVRSLIGPWAVSTIPVKIEEEIMPDSENCETVGHNIQEHDYSTNQNQTLRKRIISLRKLTFVLPSKCNNTPQPHLKLKLTRLPKLPKAVADVVAEKTRNLNQPEASPVPVRFPFLSATQWKEEDITEPDDSELFNTVSSNLINPTPAATEEQVTAREQVQPAPPTTEAEEKGNGKPSAGAQQPHLPKRLQKKKTSTTVIKRQKQPKMQMEHKRTYIYKEKRGFTPEELKLLLEYTTYKCDLCNELPNLQEFDTLKNWVIHQIEAHGRDFGYGPIDEIRKMHKIRILTKRPCPCPQCGVIKKTRADMMDHIYCKHLEIRRYTCTICHKKFFTRTAIRCHKRSSHPNPIDCQLFETVSSDLISPTPATTEEPREQVHPATKETRNLTAQPQLRKTVQKSKTSTTVIKRQKQPKKQMENKRIACPYIYKEKRGYTPEELKLLLEYTTYKCDLCNELPNFQEFDTLKNWVIHQIETHGRDFGYGPIDEIRKKHMHHIRILTKLPCPCPQCGVIKNSRVDMLDHIYCKHLEIRRYTCTICQKKFFTRTAIRCHKISAHPDPNAPKNPYLCSLCGKSFALKVSWKTHERCHLTSEQKHKCDQCSALFTLKCSLKVHMLSHTDERPFLCDLCPSAFKSKQALSYHIKEIHTVKPLVAFCEVCQKGFDRKLKLKEHLIGVHKYMPDEANEASGILNRLLFKINESGEIIQPPPLLPAKICQFCQKSFQRRERFFIHMMNDHQKLEAEAREITGFRKPISEITTRKIKTGRGRPTTRSKKRLRELDTDSSYSDSDADS